MWTGLFGFVNVLAMGAWLMLASVLYDRGRAAEAAAAHGQAFARGIDTPGLRSNELLYLNSRDDLPAEEIFHRHREWGRRHGGTVESKAHANTPEPGRRLKVGYLSPDFRGHSVGYFLLPQIPVSPQTITTSPILSGAFSIEQ